MKEKIFSDIEHLSKDQIRDYLSGKLSDKQRFTIENHLLDCEFCSAAVEGFSAHYDFEKDKQLEKLKGQFQGKEKARTANIRPIQRKSSLFNRIAAAAAILFLGVASWMYWNNQSDQRLFAKYFETYESEQLALRGEGDVALNPMLENALEVYRAEDYLNSIPLFESYLEEDSENTVALFHAGLASLEAGQSRKAIQYLEQVRFNDEQYYEDASWYLALAHLRLKQEKEAKGILEDLQKIENGFYEEQVKGLLSGLGG